MSLTCRRVKAQDSDKEYYYIRNSGVKPMSIELYEKIEDVPKELRHYCENLDTITVDPCTALFMRIAEELYPNLPVCKELRREKKA